MKIPFALSMIATLCLSQSLWAASDRPEKDITAPLSTEAKAVINQLNELTSLPAGEWRYHVGNLPHGESVDLDDSSWKLVKPDSHAPQEAAWYRQPIEIPTQFHGYDLTGARIWFRFTASAKGSNLPQIIYFNGRRVALGDDLEPIILFDNAKPGDKVLVAVKLMPSSGEKTFKNVEMKIDFPTNRINPEEVHNELLSSLALLPSLTHDQNNSLNTLEKAIKLIDLKSLNDGNQMSFDASLKQSHDLLETINSTLKQATIYLTGNSHIDAAYKWPWTESVDVVKRTFATTLQLMNEYPDYKFTQSSPQFNEWIAEKYPSMHEQIKQRIKEGRWELVGGMWVEPDLNLPDGESIARSILIGKRWIQNQYGVDVRIGWNPDSFGYNWQLPQIYKKSGIDYFITQKMDWSDTNLLPLKLFWWQSPDGSKVLTYFPHDFGHKNLNPVRLSKDLALAREDAPGMKAMLDLYGVGDHGGGPTRAALDEGEKWMQADRIAPRMKFTTAQDYFTTIEKQIAKESPVWNYESIAKGYHAPSEPTNNQIAIPTWNSELYLEYHRGVYTTQAQQKHSMRESTEAALNSEKLASLAWVFGDTYPNEKLTEAWKKIVFNDFHDLAAGSGITVLYKDAQRDYEQVRLTTNEISHDALSTITAQVDTQTPIANSVPLFVFNPLAWQRNATATVDVQMPTKVESVSLIDADGKTIPSQMLASDNNTHRYKLLANINDIPSLGYKIIYATPTKNDVKSDLTATDTSLENAFLRVEVDKKSGCITSIYNKQTKMEVLAKEACGNQLQVFNDTPKKYDAWNIDPGTLDHPLAELNQADSVALMENTPLRSSIRVKKTWGKSTFVQDITLYSQRDELEISNDIDWHETHILLKTAFPLAATSAFATYEIPYGTIDRPTTRNNSWEQAQFEVPALRFADLGNAQSGMSLLNDGKYGYDAKDNVLRLTLLRSPIEPDPYADQGRHHFRFALYPHAGTWKDAQSIRRGYEFNQPLIITQVSAHDGRLPKQYSFVSGLPGNVILSAMKKSEDNNALIFHLYETEGKVTEIALHVPTGAQSATTTNLLEQAVGSSLKVKDNLISTKIKPYEILSLQVNYPT